MPYLFVAFAFLVALPWLNPFALGPSTGAVALLFSWVCALLYVSLQLSRYVGTPTKPAYSDDSARPTIAAWLFAGLLSCAIGFCQYFGASDAFPTWINQTGPGEAFANLRQRNQFATLTLLSFAALMWSAVGVGSKVSSEIRLTRWRTLGFWIAAVVLMAGNASSNSRTGLLQLVAVSALALWWGAWRVPAVRQVLVVGVLVYLIATTLLPLTAGLDPQAHGALARLQAGDAPCASRLTLWSNVIDLIQQKPLFGWGWGNLDYAHYVNLYPGERFCDILDNAHNLPLHLAVELGVPFALLFCGLVIWRIARLKPWAETDRTRQLAWMVLMVIGLHSLVEYPLWYGPFQMTVGLCIWMLWRRPESEAGVLKPDLEPNRPPAHVLIAGAAIVSIAFLAVVAWDYRRVSQIYLPPGDRAAAYQADTLAKSSETWFFKDTARFAQLSLMQLKPDNAQQVYDLALSLLPHSPEARVVEKLIESATMLGRLDEAVFHLARFKAAFPQEYAAWRVKTGVAAQ